MLRPTIHARAGATRAIVAVAALALAGLAVPAARAESHVVACSKHRHELARSGGSVVWKQSGSVYGCVAGYVDAGDHSYDEPASKARRLGPWSTGSRIVFDGVEASWAYRKQLRSGAAVDRLYAVDVRDGHPWLRGARAGFDAADRQVAELRLGQNLAAWVTTKGTVVAAAEGGFGDPAEPDPFDLDLVGAGTAGSAGLVETLAPADRRLLIGTFTTIPQQALATLRLKRLSDADMENEECIGSYRWEITVKPLADAPRVGGIWRAAYFPTSAYCG